jgi:Tuberculosis necrotizing toxin
MIASVQKGGMHLLGLVVVTVLSFMAVACAPAQSSLNPALSAEWLRWPPNDGCAGVESTETLQPGTIIDRYGSENGSYFASPGTPYAARALSYDPAKSPYNAYVVRKPLEVEECTTAPWFGEPGGGIQFKAAEPALRLKSEGIIASQ